MGSWEHAPDSDSSGQRGPHRKGHPFRGTGRGGPSAAAGQERLCIVEQLHGEEPLIGIRDEFVQGDEGRARRGWWRNRSAEGGKLWG